MADILSTLEKLSASDICAGLQTRGENVLLWIGDELQGIGAQRDFRFAQMDQAAQWLQDAACQLYPASRYAQDRGVEDHTACPRH